MGETIGEVEELGCVCVGGGGAAMLAHVGSIDSIRY